MIEIIPAINVNSFEEIQEKIKLVESIYPPTGGWIQIDVNDGTFTKVAGWHQPSDLLGLETNLNIEVHLMINDIDRRIDDWFLPQVKRIIFQIETSKDPHLLIKRIKEAGKEVGIAIAPGTSWTQAGHYHREVELFQVLGVHPGLSGQKVQEEIFDKIKEIKNFCKISENSCIIEVDGGMNIETAKRAIEAGADIIVAGSAIFSAEGGPTAGWKKLYESFN